MDKSHAMPPGNHARCWHGWCEALILSHIASFGLEAAVDGVKKAYSGPVTVGADLQCTPVI